MSLSNESGYYQPWDITHGRSKNTQAGQGTANDPRAFKRAYRLLTNEQKIAFILSGKAHYLFYRERTQSLNPEGHPPGSPGIERLEASLSCIERLSLLRGRLTLREDTFYPRTGRSFLPNLRKKPTQHMLAVNLGIIRVFRRFGEG